MLKSKKTALIVLAAGVLISLVLILGKPKPEPTEIPTPAPQQVSILIAESVTQEVAVISQGEVKPRHSISLIAQVPGLLTAVSDNFVAGGFVAQNEVLAQIDIRDYQIAVAQAESLLAEAQQRLAEEKGRGRQAKREWRDLGNAEANALFLRQPQMTAAQSAKRAAQANVQKANLDLERTAIKTPFDGRVVRTEADMGQYISAGSEIAKLFSTNDMEIRLPITAQQLHILGLNTSGPLTPHPVKLFPVNGKTATSWQGSLVRTEAQLDANSRLYYVVAQVKKPYAQESGIPSLEPGMFVRAQISSSPIADTTSLPKSALIDNTTVFRVNNENKLVKQPVDILQQSSKQIIVQGLPSGTIILTEPPGYLKAGDTIDPLETEL